jgi:hypothetical protein
MRSENEIIGALLVIVQRDPRYPFIFDIRSGIEAHAWAIPATKLPTSCQTVCRRGRIAAHSGRACANGTRDAPSRLIKLKKLEAEEAAGLISSGFFVGLLQLGWARGHENAFAAAVDIADRHHNRSVVRLRSGRCDSPAEPK